MIDANLIHQLRKNADTYDQKIISDEWAAFNRTVHQCLVAASEKGNRRVKFFITHKENVAKATELLEGAGFKVSTFSGNQGSGIFAEY